MRKYLAPSVFVTFLIISTALQCQAAKLSEQVSKQTKIIGNTDNVKNLHNACRRPTGLSVLLPQELVDVMCSKMEKWMHRSLTKTEVPVSPDLKQLLKELYKRLGKRCPATKAIVPQARKEYRMLGDEERQLFHDALNVLKNTSLGDTTYYDALVDIHQETISPGAHWGPAFLGWHKQYMLAIESGLQAVDPSITLPYWDSCMDNRLEEQRSDNIMWTEDFMGTREGHVVTGPFAYWRMVRPVEGSYFLWRGNGSGPRPLSDEEFEMTMKIEDYRRMTYFVDPFYEVVHGTTHVWVGGPMDYILESPNDPSFFLHHSFVDLMMDQQRANVVEKHGEDAYFYPTVDDEEAFGVGDILDPLAENPTIRESAEDSYHYPLRQLLPFDLLNQDSLDEKYLTTYYFEPRPTCSAANPDCGSPYLFCIDGSFLCAPRLVSGTNCQNFETSNPCYKGQCIDGICQDSTKINS